MIKVCKMFQTFILHSTLYTFFHIEQENIEYGLSPLNTL